MEVKREFIHFIFARMIKLQAENKQNNKFTLSPQLKDDLKVNKMFSCNKMNPYLPEYVGLRRPDAGDPPGPGDHRHQDQGGRGHRGDARPLDPNLQAAQAEDRHNYHVHRYVHNVQWSYL